MAIFAFRLWHEEEGQGVAEYALILVLITLVAIVSTRNIAAAASRIYSGAAHTFAYAQAHGQPGKDSVGGSGQRGWSQSGAGNPFPIQNDATNNVPGSRAR